MLRNPIEWPNNAKCAVAFTFDMDSDSEFHSLNPESARKMISTLSWLRYDRVAIPRILDLFARHDLKQTFFIPGWTAERYRAVVAEIVSEGHEIAHHGYLHERPNTLSSGEHEYWFLRAIEALSNVTGSRPVGFRAPFYGYAPSTTDLMAREGFIYDSSLMGDDLPYLLNGEEGAIWELPTDWAMDDWPQYVHNPDLHFDMPIKSPKAAMEVFRSQFDSAYKHGSLWITVWHPFVTGRLARLDAVEELIEYMKSFGDVWFASLREIAEHAAASHQAGTWSPVVESMPPYVDTIDELNVRRHISGLGK